MQQKNQENLRKKDALEEIKQKRIQKPKPMKQDYSSSGSESGEIQGNKDSDEDSDSSSDSNLDSKSILSLSSDSYGKNKKSHEIKITLQDIEKARITRSFIEKHHDLNVFDVNIVGAFVKINISGGNNRSANGYLLGQIKEINDNDSKPYTFMNKQNNKYILVSHAHQEKNFNFNIISNSPLTEQEFKVWKDRMEKVKLFFLIYL